MKAPIVAAATMLALAGAPGVGARPNEPRSVTQQYVAGGLDETWPTGEQGFSIQKTAGGVEFEGGPENSVSIVITDKSGQPVAAKVSQPGVGLGSICGSTKKPLRIKPGVEVDVWFMNGACGSGRSIVTTGTVTATFGARP